MDYILFTKVSCKSITLVLIYVDDLLIAENSSFDIEHLKVMLAQRLHMKDLGPVSYFLGLEISRSHDGFFISQKHYTMDLSQEFGMTSVTPLKLHVSYHFKLTSTTGTPLFDPHPYQRLTR